MKIFLPLIVLLFLCSVTNGQVKTRTAFGLHQQFLQNRAIKGYKTTPAFQWKAQTFPGLVGANRSSGYWQSRRYHFYQPQPQPTYYRQPAPTHYYQPTQTYYQQPAQTTTNLDPHGY